MAPAYTALCCLLGSAGAWSSAGHRRVALIADSLLGRHREQVYKMIGGQLAEFSGWEADMTQAHPETDVIHWHRQTPEWSCGGPPHFGNQSGGPIRCDGSGVAKESLLCAMAHFFDHFAHEALLVEYPPENFPIDAPKTLMALYSVDSIELDFQHYLRWLAGLIGDAHQPLHWLRERGYGADVRLLYKDEEYTLLSFWEQYLPAHLPAPQGVTYLDEEYKKRLKGWQERVPTELFRSWSHDMSDSVCSQIYGTLGLQLDAEQQLTDPVVVTDELFQRWQKLAVSLTNLAGERLAFVLLDILEHRRHGAAHKEGRGRLQRRRRWLSNLGTNGGVAAIVVTLTLFVLHWHRGGGRCCSSRAARDL